MTSENGAVRIVGATGLVVLCLAVVAGCGKSHHSTLFLKVVGHPSPQQRLDTASVLRRRLDLLGIHDAKMRLGTRRITISTRHPVTPQQRRILTEPGSLAMYDLEADLDPSSMNGYLPRPSRRRVLAQAHTTLVRCAIDNGCPGAPAKQPATYWYLFQHYPKRSGDAIPELTGRDLERSRIRAEVSSTGQGNVVLLGFTPAGKHKFREITQTEAARGQALADAAGRGGSANSSVVQRYAQHFAIVLDGKLLSTPYIDYKQNPDGIDVAGTGAELSNLPSSEAKELAILLRSGALPARVVVR
jgi:preprotein translocase subunit SecD